MAHFRPADGRARCRHPGIPRSNGERLELRRSRTDDPHCCRRAAAGIRIAAGVATRDRGQLGGQQRKIDLVMSIINNMLQDFFDRCRANKIRRLKSPTRIRCLPLAAGLLLLVASSAQAFKCMPLPGPRDALGLMSSLAAPCRLAHSRGPALQRKRAMQSWRGCFPSRCRRSSEPRTPEVRGHDQFSTPRSGASQSRLPSSLVSETATERPWLLQTVITGFSVGAE